MSRSIDATKVTHPLNLEACARYDREELMRVTVALSTTEHNWTTFKQVVDAAEKLIAEVDSRCKGLKRK